MIHAFEMDGRLLFEARTLEALIVMCFLVEIGLVYHVITMSI